METYNNVALLLPSQATPEGKWRCYRKPFGLKIVVLKRGLKFEFDLTLKMCLAIIMFITRSQADHLWGRPHRIWHWVLKTSVNTFNFSLSWVWYFYSLIQLSPKLKSKLTWLSTELGFKSDFQVPETLPELPLYGVNFRRKQQSDTVSNRKSCKRLKRKKTKQKKPREE